MKGIIIDLKDISDSREVMESKEPPKIRWFIGIMSLLFVIAILFSFLFKIDEYSKVTGEIRTSEALGTVISSNNCKIEEIYVEEGKKVKQGDVLYVLDTDYAKEQKKIIERNLEKNNLDLENTKLLKRSIEQDKNLFINNDDDSDYYYRFSQYKNGVLLTAKEFEQNNMTNNLNNEDNSNSLSSILSSIASKKDERASYQNMINAVKNDFLYSGRNDTVNSIFDEYENTQQKNQMIFEQYLEQYNNLEQQFNEQSEKCPITSEQLQEIKTRYEKAYSKVQDLKNEFLTEINTQIIVIENQSEQENLNINDKLFHLKKLKTAIENEESFESDIPELRNSYIKYKENYKNLMDEYNATYAEYQILYAQFLEQNGEVFVSENDLKIAENNYKNTELEIETQKLSFITQIQSKIDSLTDEISSLENNKVKLETALKNSNSNKEYEDLTGEKLKNEAIISINNEISTINNNISSMESQLIEINETIKNSKISANIDGVITLVEELNVGDVVQAGKSLCSIIPDSNELKAILYIPEKEISKIKIGQNTEYIIDAMPYSEYGRINGSIISISADSIANESSGTKFYIAQATLDKEYLSNNNGEVRYIKNGMLLEAKAICGSKKVITWLLQKINFLD